MTRLMLLAGMILAGLTMGASAQTLSYAEAGALIAKSCGPSIEKYCSKENIGTGKIMDCLKSHQADVPPQCFADFSAVFASINKRVAAQGDAYKACNADIRAYCSGVAPGDGNILSCLVDSKAVVKGTCKQVLLDAGWY
ncbi:cysteine rich repeat-containing protein [Ancylobacter lacus]|uniref:cysteine rich repeat-containing protein n=1 Tax=Ancylobacter lacus TaxID=2579970 RepID=UPI001BCFF8BF|nr:cysteine rich repeat-containing protein [Ancylobacter lacus]MBS7540810.1 hypothetical protein [Ancylobacter lacus]